MGSRGVGRGSKKTKGVVGQERGPLWKNIKMEEGQQQEDSDLVEDVERSTPLQNDLVRHLIFSHLEDGDLLNARLVTKLWALPATEEYRGRDRAFNAHWIGQREEGVRRRRMGDRSLVLDDVSVVGFLDIMTHSPLIPIQQLSFKLELLYVSPNAFLQLLTFIAPWIKTLRIFPFVYWNVDVKAPLGHEEAKRVVEWTSVLQDFPTLQFPTLETLEVGEKYYNRPLHQTLALPMMTVLKKIIQGAGNLTVFKSRAQFFGGYDAMADAEREATKFITQALPCSLKRLGFDTTNCAVDYKALTTLDLQLEKFYGKGKPESAEAFIKFLDGQKMNLQALRLRDLEDIYGQVEDFPRFPLLTYLRMNTMASSTLVCLKAFPTLETLHLDMEGEDVEEAAPVVANRLPTHPSIRKLYIPDNGDYSIISFALVSNVLPNLTHLHLYCMDFTHLTGLFTHLTHLQSLSLGLESLRLSQDFESVLSGIPPHLCALTKKFDVEDDSAFDAVSLIASKSGEATIGLANLKDLRVLEFADDLDGSEFFLTKVTLQTAFMKMESLKEIRLLQQPKEACQPVLDALRRKGIYVRVLKAME